MLIRIGMDGSGGFMKVCVSVCDEPRKETGWTIRKQIQTLRSKEGYDLGHYSRYTRKPRKY